MVAASIRTSPIYCTIEFWACVEVRMEMATNPLDEHRNLVLAVFISPIKLIPPPDSFDMTIRGRRVSDSAFAALPILTDTI